jgi:60 kDa SS-A/Ro ribonucleoprotein
MTRFNASTKGKNTDPAKADTTNYEGAPVYKLGDDLALYSLAATSLLADKFYAKSADELKRLRALVQSCPPSFTARLAIYCREQMHLRTVPGVLAVELVKAHGKDNALLVRRMLKRIIQRPDEITEILSYYVKTNPSKSRKGHALSSLATSLKLGLADAFTQFDEYQLAKYKQEDKDITLRDAMFVTHPKPQDATQEAAFKALADKTLETPFTWETELSAKGNTKETWESLIASKKMGYMATLRNLRNIVNAGVSDEAIESVCAYLSSEGAVRKSKQLPFRFVTAYRELCGDKAKNFDRRLTTALEKAAEIAASSITGFTPEDRVLVACDVSGSMSNMLSDKSSLQLYEVGLILASYLNHVVSRCDVGCFSNDWNIVRLPTTNILETSKDLRRHFVNGGTEGWKVLDWLFKSTVRYTKVIFFTDCQWWEMGSDLGIWGMNYRSVVGNNGHFPPKLWAAYKSINPEARAYYIDIAGYGNAPMRVETGDVFFVSGWSERIFDFIHAIENGSSVVKMINQVEL